MIIEKVVCNLLCQGLIVQYIHNSIHFALYSKHQLVNWGRSEGGKWEAENSAEKQTSTQIE